MKVHQFTLIVEGPDLQDDAYLGTSSRPVAMTRRSRVGAPQYLDFDRKTPTFADAVFSAAEAVESAVRGIRVVHLEPDELVTMAEIAECTGRTRDSVRLLSGDRGPGGFPAAAATNSSVASGWEMAGSCCVAFTNAVGSLAVRRRR